MVARDVKGVQHHRRIKVYSDVSTDKALEHANGLDDDDALRERIVMNYNVRL